MSIGSPAPRDENFVTVMVGVDPTSSRSNPTIVPVGVDPVTNRVLVSSSGGLLTPNTDFDYIDIQQTSATVETYVYKQGGSGGSTVQTIVVTYTDSTKNDLDKVEYS
jgi:hypothetical protein